MCCSKQVRSWSHVSWLTSNNLQAKTLLPFHPKIAPGQQKRKKKLIKTVTKLFTLHANAIIFCGPAISDSPTQQYKIQARIQRFKEVSQTDQVLVFSPLPLFGYQDIPPLLFVLLLLLILFVIISSTLIGWLGVNQCKIN